MRFGNFLFPESRSPDEDGLRIHETLQEATLSEDLGIDALWLAEHHFDGGCAYVDPISFASTLASLTRRVQIGFAVVQTSLHHPIRLAEQLSLLDNLTKGRLIIGLGRGTNLNIYEYQGYDIPSGEAQSRYQEIDEILMKAWTQEAFDHHGKHWHLRVPMLRPRPFTKPHPFVIHASSTEGSMVELARKGLPFLMNVQSIDVTRQRLDLYRSTMHAGGFSEEAITRNLESCWVWRNVFVADTDAEAERIGVPAFQAMVEHRSAMRKRIYAEQGIAMKVDASGPGSPANVSIDKALVYGSPATVAEKFDAIHKTGAGGVIMALRLGPLPHEAAVKSINLFMKQVAPQFRLKAAA